MMFYIDNFAGNMKGVQSKLDYIEQCNVNYIHLMPFLETPKGRIRRRLCRVRFPKGAKGTGDDGRPG